MTGRLTRDDLAGVEVDLLGLGIDVCAVIPHLDRAASVHAWVDDPSTVTEDERAVCARSGVPIGGMADWPGSGSVVVRAPGFPRYRADVAARIRRQRVTTPVDLWLNTHGGDLHTVLVTGTKGKSTVATMVAALVPGSQLCGNIGVPIWSVGKPARGSTVVVEVSSYQAADTRAVVDLAILTSLGEDHVTWHGSVERYHADKLGPVLAARRVLTVAALETVIARRKPDGELRTAEGTAGGDGLDGLPAHMAANARLARAAAGWLHEDFGTALVPDPEATLLALPPLPGRLRLVPTGDGRRWYDDALASNPSGAAAAVEAFTGGPLWLIVGGVDRRVSLAVLIDAAATAARQCSFNVVAIPDSGPEIIDQLISGGVPIDQAATAPDVAAAVSLIARRAGPDSVVLFSPAAPTPPQHGTWSHRSEAFVEAVQSLAEAGG